MMDIFKKPITIIIIVVAVIIAMVWSYFSNLSEKKQNASVEDLAETTQLTDLTNINPADYDDAIKREFATAKNKAEASDANNKLAAIDVTLPSLELNSGETRYVFSSSSNPFNNWTISFDQDSGNSLRAIIPKEDYLGDVASMNTALWKFNFVAAIQIAEKNGGLDWRNSNGLSGARITLKHGGKNNWLLWTVTYSSGSDTFTKIIDSNSGNIVTE